MELYQIEETNRLRRIINWIVDLVVVLSLAWLVVYEFGAQIQIVGQSMTPELRGGDVVLMDRLTYDFEEPQRFENTFHRAFVVASDAWNHMGHSPSALGYTPLCPQSLMS